VRVLDTIPVLRIFSVEKAKEFYVGFLGFAIDWEHRYEGVVPLYLQVSRGGCVLHLSEHHGDGCPGTVVYTRVTGLDEYHQELTAKNYGYLRPGIESTGHDSRWMEVIDPFGNRIRFDESSRPETADSLSQK
jgi:catechol 2,3-dioxygenase-like lactoylglutathione lyase family enzyme